MYYFFGEPKKTMPKKYIEYVIGEAEDYEEEGEEEEAEDEEEGDEDEEDEEEEDEPEAPVPKSKKVKTIEDEEEREVEPYDDEEEDAESEEEPAPKPKVKKEAYTSKVLKEEEWKPVVAVRKTSNYISWHEVAALITARAVQLTSPGIHPLIDPEGDFAPESIAKREFQNMLRKIAEETPNPKEWTVMLGIERKLLDGTIDFYKADEVIYPRGFLEDP